MATYKKGTPHTPCPPHPRGRLCKRSAQISHAERHFLGLLLEHGSSIAVGSATGHALHERGLVQVVKRGRYGITLAGILAITGAERRVVAPARTRSKPR
jgi:hypothetical protein